MTGHSEGCRLARVCGVRPALMQTHVPQTDAATFREPPLLTAPGARATMTRFSHSSIGKELTTNANPPCNPCALGVRVPQTGACPSGCRKAHAATQAQPQVSSGPPKEPRAPFPARQFPLVRGRAFSRTPGWPFRAVSTQNGSGKRPGPQNKSQNGVSATRRRERISSARCCTSSWRTGWPLIS